MTSEHSLILSTLRTVIPRPGSEARLAEDVLAALRRAGLNPTHEATLTRGRVDLRVGSVAIELKVKGSVENVLAQLTRYAEDPTITEMILVTSSAKHRGIPSTVGGLPLSVVYLPRL